MLEQGHQMLHMHKIMLSVFWYKEMKSSQERGHDLQKWALACSPDSCSGACTRRASRRHCRAASAQERAPGWRAHCVPAPDWPGPCPLCCPAEDGVEKGVSTRRAGKKSNLPRGGRSAQGHPPGECLARQWGTSGEVSHGRGGSLAISGAWDSRSRDAWNLLCLISRLLCDRKACRYC